ncbi:MAG: selenoneine biosynthesis selenosugar synthase SenB [Betaproteobacteria bacterium]|nr:selenoneine biosynthesis selenosugar synthase SenB [Betaproteobacteria bacterium]
MKIALITPAAAHQRTGNRKTAQRWAQFLRQAGHQVTIQVVWDQQPADLMIALHARRSHASIAAFGARHPDLALIVVLTGTDLYRDIRNDPQAKDSLHRASDLVVLQERGLAELSPGLRGKAHVIYQSASTRLRPSPRKTRFEVCVIGHLRDEKDPFRAAWAAQQLPATSHLRVAHMGAALQEGMDLQARALEQTCPRYRWLGELPHWAALRRLSHAQALVVSSAMEGGANVICEAVTLGVPVIASRVPGNVGMLGRHYAGYYEWGNTPQLALLLHRAETDPAFLARLRSQCARRKPLFLAARERSSVVQLVVDASARCLKCATGARVPRTPAEPAV